MLGQAPVALAHAALLRADPPDLCLLPGGESLPADMAVCRTGAVLPEPPRSVQLRFSEPVQPVGRGLRVVGPNGRRVDHAPVWVTGAHLSVAVDARAPGTYRVVWSVISPDTHPEFGTMAFSVGRPGGVIAEGPLAVATPGPWGLALGAAAHLLHFAGYALGFGLFAAAWLAGAGVAEAPASLWRVIGIGVLLLLAAEPVALAAEALSLGALGGADPAVLGAVLDSSFGRVVAQRLAAAILLWVLAGAIRAGSLRAAWTVPLLGIALAFVDGEAAHAIGVRPPWWGLSVNTVHVCAMGLWAGVLALVLLPSSAASVPGRRISVRALAATAAASVVAAGTVMSFQHLAAVRDLVVNPYGRTLGIKIAIVIAAAGLGWSGLRRPLPRLLRWEVAALTVVIALAGLLVLLRPPVR